MRDMHAVPVALLYPTDAAGTQLREALTRCGTPIVYETLTSRADRDALEGSGARVVVVNLDAEVDNYLDDIQSLLVGCDCRVVFNDSQASSGLSGWDEARWMRHLVAKIRGEEDANPPRPAGALPVPARADITPQTPKPEPGSDDTPGAPVPHVDFDPAFDDLAFAADASSLAHDDVLVVPQIDVREVEASDTPDFSGWSIEDPDYAPPAPVAKGTEPVEFGVELVDPAEYLAPAGGTAFESELSLVPLDEATGAATPFSPDHENWFGAAASEALWAGGRIWVLAAATGGPQAVRTALSHLPADYPGLFLLVQQMGEEYLDVMLDQLAGSVALPVRRAVAGERANRGDVLVVPAGHTMGLDRGGIITTRPIEAANPAASLLRDLADAFGARAGAIVFSGVPVELLGALRHLRDRQGEVWVQDPDTCLVSALAEATVEVGLAHFVGSPDALGERLLAHAREPDPFNR
jgi:hypothetical protein